MAYIDKKLPFRVVKGTESKIMESKHNEGFVYFTTDTKKIYLDTATERLVMGGNTGIYYSDVKFEKQKVKMIAHRGMSGIETENTSSAFVAAGNRSYYGIECDIHVTADGEFVIIHDDDTGRVAKKDVNIEKSTFLCYNIINFYEKVVFFIRTVTGE